MFQCESYSQDLYKTHAHILVMHMVCAHVPLTEQMQLVHGHTPIDLQSTNIALVATLIFAKSYGVQNGWLGQLYNNKLQI